MDGEILRLLGEWDWKPEAGGLNPKRENTRELLTPGNINQQELIQKPPYLRWNQAPPKNQQVSEQDIPH